MGAVVTPNLEKYIGVIATAFLKKILFMLTIYTQRSKLGKKLHPESQIPNNSPVYRSLKKLSKVISTPFDSSKKQQ